MLFHPSTQHTFSSNCKLFNSRQRQATCFLPICWSHNRNKTSKQLYSSSNSSSSNNNNKFNNKFNNNNQYIFQCRIRPMS